MAAEWKRYESRFWRMTSLALRHRGRTVLVDPGVATDEVARIRGDVGEVEAVLITHTDWDHIVGMARFPKASVHMAPAAAVLVRDGSAGRVLAEKAAAFPDVDDSAPRVDVVLEPGRRQLVGSLEVETLAVPGHTACSTAFLVPEAGLLVAGDYLSPIEPPYVEVSVSLYGAALGVLARVLRADPTLIVAPGHGSTLSAAEALAIAAEDLGYLASVHEAVRRALATGASSEDAVEVGARTPAPRGTPEEGEAASRAIATLEAAAIRRA
jgi:glyoxylase-like metal-dependent hydrolase (beta-lactamase superfamily II)